MKMFYTEDGKKIIYGETNGVPTQTPSKADISGTSQDDDSGKNIAGVDPSLILSPFSSSDENSAGYPELLSNEEILKLDAGTYSMHDHYLSKFAAKKDIISNENLPKTNNEKIRGAYRQVTAGSQDTDSIRGLAIHAPIYAAGFGMNSSGVLFGNDKVGPIDLIWDDKKKMWRNRISFPAVGKVIDRTGESLYTIAALGAIRDPDHPNDLEKLSAEETQLVGEGIKKVYDVFFTEIENVFHIGEEIDGPLLVNEVPSSYSGNMYEEVLIYYDAFNDIYCCYKLRSTGMLCKLTTTVYALNENDAVEIHGYEDSTGAVLVRDPTEDSLPPEKVIFVQRRFSDNSYMIGVGREYFYTQKDTYTSFCNIYGGGSPSIGTEVGTVPGHGRTMKEGNSGFKVIASTLGGSAYIRPFKKDTIGIVQVQGNYIPSASSIGDVFSTWGYISNGDLSSFNTTSGIGNCGFYLKNPMGQIGYIHFGYSLSYIPPSPTETVAQVKAVLKNTNGDHYYSEVFHYHNSPLGTFHNLLHPFYLRFNNISYNYTITGYQLHLTIWGDGTEVTGTSTVSMGSGFYSPYDMTFIDLLQ